MTRRDLLRLPAARQGRFSRTLRHRDNLSGGGVNTVLDDPGVAGVRICATASQGSNERVFALVRQAPFGPGSGRLGWVRGSFCCSISGELLPAPDDPAQFFQAESLLRPLLAEFGYDLRVEKSAPATRDPVILVARHSNGFFFSGYSPSTTATVRLKFPHGAPVLVGTETWIERGCSTYTMPRAWHREARCFIEQEQDGELSCVEQYSGHPGIRRRLWLKGLRNATVHFYPEDRGRVIVAANDRRLYNEASVPYAAEDEGRRLAVPGITGELMISW